MFDESDWTGDPDDLPPLDTFLGSDSLCERTFMSKLEALGVGFWYGHGDEHARQVERLTALRRALARRIDLESCNASRLTTDSRDPYGDDDEPSVSRELAWWVIDPEDGSSLLARDVRQARPDISDVEWRRLMTDAAAREAVPRFPASGPHGWHGAPIKRPEDE